MDLRWTWWRQKNRLLKTWRYPKTVGFEASVVAPNDVGSPSSTLLLQQLLPLDSS